MEVSAYWYKTVFAYKSEKFELCHWHNTKFITNQMIKTDFEQIILQYMRKLEKYLIGKLNKISQTWIKHTFPLWNFTLFLEDFPNSISLVLPFSPYNVTLTSSLVAAPTRSPVLTYNWYSVHGPSVTKSSVLKEKYKY